MLKGGKNDDKHPILVVVRENDIQYIQKPKQPGKLTASDIIKFKKKRRPQVFVAGGQHRIAAARTAVLELDDQISAMQELNSDAIEAARGDEEEFNEEAVELPISAEEIQQFNNRRAVFITWRAQVYSYGEIQSVSLHDKLTFCAEKLLKDGEDLAHLLSVNEAEPQMADNPFVRMLVVTKQLEVARMQDYADAAAKRKAAAKVTWTDDDLARVNPTAMHRKSTHVHRDRVPKRDPREQQRAETFVTSTEGYRYLRLFVDCPGLGTAHLHNSRWLMDGLNGIVGHVSQCIIIDVY